jgi:hypothetical protein
MTDNNKQVSLQNSGNNAKSMINSSFENLNHEQLSNLRSKAAEEALRLEVKSREQNLDYVVGKKTVEDHVETWELLDKKGKLTRQNLKSEIKTGAGRMQIESRSGATCFIASAVYEDPNHIDVIVLRSFRDNKLSKNIFGRMFIKFYWAIGPCLARHLSNKPKLKIIIRKCIHSIVRSIIIFFHKNIL